MQQRSTEQCSTVDSRRRLTYFKTLGSHSVSAVSGQFVQLLLNVKSSVQSVLRNLSTVCWGAVKICNIFWIFDIHKVLQVRWKSVVYT